MGYGFKVIRNKSRNSAIMDYEWCRSAVVKYPVKEKVQRRPKHGPLAVFSNYEYAEDFKKQNGFIDLIIVRCRYKKSKDDSLWFERYGNQERRMSLPTGTILADEITCLE